GPLPISRHASATNGECSSAPKGIGGAMAADEPRRHAGYGRVGGDVASDDCARADNRTLSDRHPAEDDSSGTERCPLPNESRSKRPVGWTLQSALRGCRPRVVVVDEEHAVTHEHFVLDRDA